MPTKSSVADWHVQQSALIECAPSAATAPPALLRQSVMFLHCLQALSTAQQEAQDVCPCSVRQLHMHVSCLELLCTTVQCILARCQDKEWTHLLHLRRRGCRQTVHCGARQRAERPQWLQPRRQRRAPPLGPAARRAAGSAPPCRPAACVGLWLGLV